MAYSRLATDCTMDTNRSHLVNNSSNHDMRDFLWVRLVTPGTEIQQLRPLAFGTVLVLCQGRDGLRTEWR